MELSEYARMILYGAGLQEKLYRPAAFTDTKQESAVSIPAFPKRSPLISLKNKNSKKGFPSKSSLNRKENRGRVLHFFANHELLALELMALVLLKFPKAPKTFRLGIGKTMLEEQQHLELYLNRMNQLGIGFGEEYLNDFFWKCIATVKSPLEFTAKMSLTFEQGNLDFSYYYWKLFEKLEDYETSKILKQVYEDEIQHVKHGAIWFRRFKDQQGFNINSEWDVYSQILSKPLSPVRARGPIFIKQAREEAGLNPDFIEQIQHYQGSKGRPPCVWIFDPNYEEQLLFPNKTFLSTKDLSNDLTNIFICLANEHDLIVSSRPPSKDFIMGLRKLGLKTPAYLSEQELKELKGPISRVKPWGWNPKIFDWWSKRYTLLTAEHPKDKEWLKSGRFENVPLKKLVSKVWATEILAAFKKSLALGGNSEAIPYGPDPIVCGSLTDFSAARAKLYSLGFAELIIKAPYGTSGRNQRKIPTLNTLNTNEINWVRNTLNKQSHIIVEPYFNKVLDLSVQIMIKDSEDAKILGITRFLTHSNRSYFGHILGQKLFDCDTKIKKAIYQKNDAGLSYWDVLKQCAKFTAKKLQSAGYSGPAGIDAFIFKHNEQYFLRPLVELNCRYTMGHCAMALEKHLPRDSIGLFSIKPKQALNQHTHPIERKFCLKQVETLNHKPIKISQAINPARVILNDPKQAESVIVSLIVLPK